MPRWPFEWTLPPTVPHSRFGNRWVHCLQAMDAARQPGGSWEGSPPFLAYSLQKAPRALSSTSMWHQTWDRWHISLRPIPKRCCGSPTFKLRGAWYNICKFSVNLRMLQSKSRVWRMERQTLSHVWELQESLTP